MSDVTVDIAPFVWVHPDTGHNIFVLAAVFELWIPDTDRPKFVCATYEQARRIQDRVCETGRTLDLEIRPLQYIDETALTADCTCRNCHVGVVWDHPRNTAALYRSRPLCRTCDDVACARRWNLDVAVVREHRDRNYGVDGWGPRSNIVRGDQ